MLPNVIILFVITLAISVLLISKSNIEEEFFEYILAYLSGNFFFESLAFYFQEKPSGNIAIYNLEMIFEVSFFLLLYRKITVRKTQKKWISAAILLFITFAILNIQFFQHIHIFNSNTYTLGSFLLIFACSFFLYEFIKTHEDKNPLFSLMFWVSLGVLFCYLGNFPFLSNVNQLFSENEALALRLRVISISVNVLLYLLITVGILCNRKD